MPAPASTDFELEILIVSVGAFFYWQETAGIEGPRLTGVVPRDLNLLLKSSSFLGFVDASCLIALGSASGLYIVWPCTGFRL